MQRTPFKTYTVSNVPLLKQKMLNWVKPFNIFCFLDNCNYNIAPHYYECIIAAGSRNFISSQNASFNKIDDIIKEKRWLFGHLSFELQHQFFNLDNVKKDAIGFPSFYFFEPEILLLLKNSQLTIYANNADEVYKQIVLEKDELDKEICNVKISPRLSKQQYIQKIASLKNHIQRGDCYEINFCQEFFADDAKINPFILFQNLVRLSPNPFAAFYRLNDKYLICASPERFLSKKNNKLVSQPIKGTAPRVLNNIAEDNKVKIELQNSQKERAENVMVVDLVRNDLSKICKEGTVMVDELFGIYTFPQVHQMISTISGVVEEESFSKIIEAAFPMGSMTGAPKHRVLQLVNEYEVGARGIFSGSVGYISPDGDFDFNVVIRSIMYNASTRYLSYQVGSGITYYCDAEKEWEECILKATAIKKVLGFTSTF